MNICSLIAYCLPENVNAVSDRLNTLPQTEVSVADAQGKLIVIVEETPAYSMTNLINAVQFSDGVLSVMLVYQRQVS